MGAAAMKAMKKKSVSKVAKGRFAKSVVLRGTKEKTTGGLTAKDLTRNKFGKIVSKKQSALAKKRFASSSLKTWITAVQKAKKELGLKGFVAIKKGTPVYKRAKELHKN